MRALIVGLGSIGTRHAENLHTLGVTALSGVDPDEQRRARFAERLTGQAWASLEEALSQTYDLAVIASPNRYHVAQATTCADAGIHLLIEKPLGTSVAGVDELIASVQRSDLFAHMSSNWKFHPAFRTMKDLLAQKRLGRVVAVQVLAGQWLPDWHPWEDYRSLYAARADLGGGIVFDTHEFDCLSWLFGPIADVEGHICSSGALDIETHDVMVATLRFKSGVLATLQADYIQRQARRQYHITGDAASLDWDVRDGKIRLSGPAGGQNVPESIDVAVANSNTMYIDQMRHVLEGARTGAAPITPLTAAREVLRAQLALIERSTRPAPHYSALSGKN
jgi:predicted dehydrogenase